MLLGRNLRHIDPPSPGLYLLVQGQVHTLLVSTPSGMSCTQAAFCQGDGLRSPSGDLVRGKLSRFKGCSWGSRRRGVVGGAAAVYVCGGRSALNRGSQLGFRNDINGGQAEPSAVQMGKLKQRLLQSLRGEGPAISYGGSLIFPRKASWPRRCSALSAVTQ